MQMAEPRGQSVVLIQGSCCVLRTDVSKASTVVGFCLTSLV